jgi:hypothetical protein
LSAPTTARAQALAREIINFATSSGTQTINAHSVVLAGGIAGAINSGAIFQNGSGSQVINITGANGSLQMQGGSGSPEATREHQTCSGAGNQTINFLGTGGTLSLTGGTVGIGNTARIGVSTSAGGTQTITGSPVTTILGGTSGGSAGQGNTAQICSNSAGTQSITAVRPP